MGNIDLRSQSVLKSGSEQEIINMLIEIQSEYEAKARPFIDALVKIRSEAPVRMMHLYPMEEARW